MSSRSRRRTSTRSKQLTARPRSANPPRRWRYFKLFVLGVALLAAAGAIARVNVTAVHVSGATAGVELEALAQEQLHEQLLWRNLLLLPTGAYSEALAAASGLLPEQLTVEKNWRERALNINVSERPALIIWQSEGQRYSVDSRGRIIGPVTEDGDLPLVVDTSNLPVTAGAVVAPPSFVEFTVQVMGEVAEQTDLTPERILVEETISECVVTTAEGIDLRFATTEDVNNQVDNVRRTLEHARTSNTPPRAYIDVRIPYKAYYR